MQKAGGVPSAFLFFTGVYFAVLATMIYFTAKLF